MTLDEFARRIAEAPESDLNRDLSRRSPLNAVIECARRAKAIGEDEYNALLRMDAGEDFSLFVGPNDERVKSRAEAQTIPAGAFIAVIFVEHPPRRNTDARRHLILPMISLGEGKAAGCDPSQIGISGQGDGWQVVDLDDLNWLSDRPTNGYDLFTRFAVNIQKTQRLRIRYRLPGRSSPSTAGPGSSRLAWGRPEPSDSLRRDILAAAAETISGLRIEPGDDNPKKSPDQHVFRVNFRFEVGHEAFEAFFNSPHELRGHYYVDGRVGDRYTSDLLTGIAEAIDWDKSLATLKQDQIFGRTFSAARPAENARIVELVKTSVTSGKIWFAEKRSVSTSTKWQEGNNQGVAIRFSPNTRWIANPASVAGNWAAFLADTGADKGVIAPDAFAALKVKFTDALGVGHAEAGAQYRYCFSKDHGAKHGLDFVNMDVKGDWVKANGEPAHFTPNGKHFRGYQIKWFGFT